MLRLTINLSSFLQFLRAFTIFALVIAAHSTVFGGELVIDDANPKCVLPPEPEPWVTPTANFRARYEYGDQADKNASHAGTFRSRLGLLTGRFSGFQAFAEYEGTLVIDRGSYQAASVSGLGQNKTIIADPESHELNQLWIDYDGLDFADIKAGRQGINLDNQRYVGTVAWRQNMQTFDAAALTLTPFEDTTIYYSYINQVNRIFGSQSKADPAQDDFRGNTHLIHATYTGLPIGKLNAFAYFMDLHNPAGDTNSNNSFGLSLAGPLPIDGIDYYAEYGYQTDAFDSPLDYGTHYVHGKLSASPGDVVDLAIGYERLGSDRGVGYKFPLGTNHAFNGFADKFLTTPADGLQDAYATAGTKLPFDSNLALFYHKFYDADGGRDYGNEVDFVLTKKIGKGLLLLGKYAYYWGNDGPYTDTNRFSVEVNYQY